MTFTPQGAKNEVLQIICATLLTAEEVTVHNIPDILDVNNLIQLMRDMGVSVSKKGIDTYSFQAADIDFAYLESDAFLKNVPACAVPSCWWGRWWHVSARP